MSYVDQNAPGRDARSLTAAVVLHAAAIAAVLLAPAAVREITKPDGINMFNVDPPAPPPPPPEADPVLDAPAPPAQPLFREKPIVEIPLPNIDGPTTSNIPIPKLLPVPGTTPGGTGVVIQPKVIETPQAPPVLRDASRDPRYANAFQPPYPSALLRRELEGTATVRVLVGPDGRVSRVEIVSATHPDFGRATERQALSKWRFRPATEDGTPVPSWQTLTVRFTIT